VFTRAGEDVAPTFAGGGLGTAGTLFVDADGIAGEAGLEDDEDEEAEDDNEVPLVIRVIANVGLLLPESPIKTMR
jgi:hypothetical protein